MFVNKKARSEDSCRWVWWGNRLILTQGSESLLVLELVSETSEGIPEGNVQKGG